MAELYLAVVDDDSGLNKLVVLKLVHAHLSGNAKFADMLAKEARIASTLNHPNIASVIDLGLERGEQYLVMEYVHGQDVLSILRALPPGQPLDTACALEIVRSACQALHYAHTKCDLEGRPLGIVHRDVSPSNVLVSYGGSVMLVDFGIAKVGAHMSTTQTGILKGKFGYMSPEQSLGAEVDCRSDVFALGILLYELTTGQRAFVGPNSIAVMNKAIAAAYEPPESIVADYPARLAAIVAKAMQARPQDRYPSAAAMQADLDAFAIDSRLQLGEQVVRDVMERLFGTPPYPVIPAALDEPAVSATRRDQDPVTHRSTRQRWTRRAAVGLLACATAAIGWWAGASQAESRAPAPVTAATQADGAPGSRPAKTQPPAAGSDAGDTGSAEPTLEPEPRPEPAPAAEESSSVAAAKTRHRRTRGPRKTSRREPTRTEATPETKAIGRNELEGMLPPSMQ